MNRMKIQAVVSMMVLPMVVGGGVALATPTDSYFPWSWGNLRVADVHQRSDNEVHVRFRDANGAIRTYWPNSAGTDLCGGSDALYLARARTNFKEMLDALNTAGLAGRPVWVAYEPYNGRCYIKAINVTMQ
jgi:hypothetical protein